MLFIHGDNIHCRGASIPYRAVNTMFNHIDNKVVIIKLIRDITGLGLPEAKLIYEFVRLVRETAATR